MKHLLIKAYLYKDRSSLVPKKVMTTGYKTKPHMTTVWIRAEEKPHKLEFNKKNLSPEEKMILVSWTSDPEWRKNLRGGIVNMLNPDLINMYRNFDFMFEKYSSNLASSIPIYRGMQVFKKDIFEKYLREDKPFVFDDAVSSWTTSLDIAEYFGKNMIKPSSGEIYNLIFQLDKRKSTTLDIHDFSEFRKEYEVILPRGLKVKVSKIEIKNKNTAYITLEEV